jgi:hypothetical protein
MPLIEYNYHVNSTKHHQTPKTIMPLPAIREKTQKQRKTEARMTEQLMDKRQGPSKMNSPLP